MRPTRLAFAAPLLLLGACTHTARNIDAELEADFTRGNVLLTCKASSSGTCYAIFVANGSVVNGKAAAGDAATIEGIGAAADYCVDVETPDPAKCRPRPLESGKQIVHKSTVKS
jgi:hypothetical protein